MIATTAVDVHTHAMPQPLMEWLAARGLADLASASSGTIVLDPRVSGVGRGTPLPYAPAQHRVDVRLDEMRRSRVSHHVVSLPPFVTCSRAENSVLAREVIRRGNDALAEFVALAPDRLVGLGSVPVGLYDGAEEALRCLDELGLVGVALGTQGGGRDLDDPVNDELFALLAQRRAFTLLHPSAAPDPHRMREYWLPQLVGYPTETAICAARLIFSGVLERHDLVLCLAHGGGCLPALRGRLNLGWSRKDAARTIGRPPGELMNRLYYDTAVFSTTTLRALIADVGADHVLLGTDSPFELSDPDPLGTVAALGLHPADSERILAGSAATLLKLP